MLRTSNFKTCLPRKGGMIAGGAVTLATAMVLAMAPTSQAYAYLRYKITPPNSKHIYVIEFTGQGNSHAAAKADAQKGAGCNVGGMRGTKLSSSPPYILKQTWYNGTWFNAVFPVYCQGTDLREIW